MQVSSKPGDDSHKNLLPGREQATCRVVVGYQDRLERRTA